MSDEIPQIIYWKWDRQTLEDKLYREKIDDLCRRSVFTHVYVSPVWSKHEICDPLTVEAFHEAAKLLRKRDRWLVLDIDVRTARWTFAKRYPGHLLWLWQTQETSLRKKGVELTFREMESGDHFGKYPILDSRLIRLLLYRAGRIRGHDPSTLREARPDEFTAKRESTDCWKIRFHGRAEDVSHAFAVVAFQYQYPDPFSPELLPFLEQLIALYADAPLGGACLDEWGYPPYPDFSFSRAWRDPWFRHGEDQEDFVIKALHVVRPPRDHPDRSDLLSIDRIRLIRERCVEIENWFYDRVKATWGRDSFVGVHPTWHAIDPVFNASEIWKNGFDWFDVRRDFAQTDEFTPYPIRLALAHKFGDRPFFNMWYSCGSLDVDTYATETWTNARYGGRTHTLGYECPNETDVVLELAPPGLLETVSRIEERIALLNQVQESVAHSPVLVLLGMNAAVAPSANHIENGRWDMKRGALVEAFQVAVDLWRMGYICDLVPTTEIDNGSLSVDAHDRPRFGRNLYGAVILVDPELLSLATLVFLERITTVDFPLLVIGSARRDASGRDIRKRFNTIMHRASHWSHVPLPIQLDVWLRRKGLRPNDLDSGSRFNDGMAVFTSHTRKPSGTALLIDCDIEGHHVEAEAEDLFAIRLDDAGRIERLAAAMVSAVRIGGKQVLAQDPARDVVLPAILEGSLEPG